MLVPGPHSNEPSSSAFENPLPYEGTATLTKLYQNVNSTHYTLIYRCQGCFVFDEPSLDTTRAYTSKGQYLKGWGQSYTGVEQPTNNNAQLQQHDNGCGWYQVIVASATQASYSQWATQTPVGTPTATPTATASVTSSTISSIPVPTASTWDYVIVGSGAGGIPIAEKLAETGKKVLLIEKGVASSARHGGSKWLLILDLNIC
jgi:cellobiose dehydrogenase (acceptor)